MQRNRLPSRLICLFLLLVDLLSLSNFAAPSFGFGTLELQVVAGKPEVFTDPALTGGKYRASNATVWIYQEDTAFSFDGYTNKQGQLIVRDLPLGINKYEILFWDISGDMWKGEGSVFIKEASWEKKLIELKKETSAGQLP